MGLYHWYHVYADGNWHQPVAEHCKALRDGGLYEELTGLYVGFVGTLDNVGAVRDVLDEHIPGYTVAGWELEGWEQVTLEPLWRHSFDHDGLVSYAHTKGASRHDAIDTPWRRCMTYHTIVDWRRPVKVLSDGYSIVGSHWFNGGPSSVDGFGHGGMFGGNFWWTSYELLRQNPPPGTESRHHAEHWLGQLSEVTPLTPETIYDLNTSPIGSGCPDWAG